MIPRQDWVLMGEVYRTAVTLYCVLSRQSAFILLTSAPLRGMCSRHWPPLLVSNPSGFITQNQPLYPGYRRMRDFVAAEPPGLSRHAAMYLRAAYR